MIAHNPNVKLPTPRLAAEIEAFLRRMDLPDEGTRRYLEIHMARMVRTLSVTPPPGKTGRVLELGAYMHMTPPLGCVLGYKEVRGAYIGPLGRSDHKQATVDGKVVFECMVDLFDAEKDRYPYADASFDTVLACEIFEHFVHDPMHMLVECRRVLVDGGTIVLTTPNIASWTAAARVLHQNANPQLYSKYANPLGEFADQEVGHVREYMPAELEEALTAAGFEVDYLFTETPAGYEGSESDVRPVLKKFGFPLHLRGEQMFALAHKVEGAQVTRYPGFLYDM